MFTANMLSGDDLEIEGVITINGEALVSLYTEWNDWAEASTTAFAECYSGDKVAVVCGSYSQCYYNIYADNGHSFGPVNSFSGALIM